MMVQLEVSAEAVDALETLYAPVAGLETPEAVTGAIQRLLSYVVAKANRVRASRIDGVTRHRSSTDRVLASDTT